MAQGAPGEAVDQRRLGRAQLRRAKAVAVAARRNDLGPPALGQHQGGQHPASRRGWQPRPCRSARSTSRARRDAAAPHRHGRRSARGPWRRYSAGAGNSRPRHRRPGAARSRFRRGSRSRRRSGRPGSTGSRRACSKSWAAGHRKPLPVVRGEEAICGACRLENAGSMLGRIIRRLTGHRDVVDMALAQARRR